MNRKIKVALAGLGSRGKDTYAKAAELFPEKMEITAIADINPQKVAMVAERYHIPKERCYASAEDMLKEDKLADVMFITTQDRQHVKQAIPGPAERIPSSSGKANLPRNWKNAGNYLK